VELAGAISDIAQLYMRHDFRHIDPSKSRVLLLDGGPRVLAAYPEDLSAKSPSRAGPARRGGAYPYAGHLRRSRLG